MSRAPEIWVQTNEVEDVAASLRHCFLCYANVDADPQAWKWVALSIHAALQGACVAHLTTTARPVGAVTKQNTREWLRYFEESRTDPKVRPPRTCLMPLPDLLKAIRKPHSAGDRSNADGVALSDEEYNWLARFHDGIRNEFVHFAPRGWSIEVSGLPELTRLCVRIIRDIAKIGWAFRFQSEDWYARFNASLEALEKV